MSPIENLTRELGKLPGVGAKTSLRLAYHLVKGPRDNLRRLARALELVADRVHPCPACGNYCDAELCPVCGDPSRDREVICVVEEAYEVGAIERAGRYRGLFHVLGGRMSPLDGIGPDELAIDALVQRLDTAGGRVKEVILATNASVEGEATAVYLEGVLRGYRVRVTRLARGIPVGSDLEYIDGTTIAEALDGRREM
ncbi:MAG: recombination protein RecR [Gemmatimonadetes bacterium]|nr:recombination protein RecR [Gemmatimonadota bacterium]MYE69462.1 recombination protein RecR [Gemmatimonadota bacterium]MYJ67263.1 recombination protein RecR [Gemmatimonadota bacterium]